LQPEQGTPRLERNRPDVDERAIGAKFAQACALWFAKSNMPSCMDLQTARFALSVKLICSVVNPSDVILALQRSMIAACSAE
jgi:hypothetical protein